MLYSKLLKDLAFFNLWVFIHINITYQNLEFCSLPLPKSVKIILVLQKEKEKLLIGRYLSDDNRNNNNDDDNRMQYKGKNKSMSIFYLDIMLTSSWFNLTLYMLKGN